MLTDAELDRHLHAVYGRMQAALDRHVDTQAGLRRLLHDARYHPVPDVEEDVPDLAPAPPRPDRRLTVFRAWFVACALLTLYLLWVVVVEYRVRSHEPVFVLGNLAVLFAWWGVFVRTWIAWTRHAAEGDR